jgi:DNA-3-methyladenine glycosylase II
MDSLEFKRGLDFLSKNDKVLDKIIRHAEILPPRKRKFDFSAFVFVIVNQQLTSKASETIRLRILDLFDNELSAENFQKFKKKDLLKCGISEAKYHYINEISKYLLENPNFFRTTKKLNAEQLTDTLSQFKGIGIWSSNILAMFYCGELDIFPYGDVTLEKAIFKLYNVERSKLDILLQRWSPYRSVASVCLWEWYDQKIQI